MSTSLDASTVQRAIERAQALARELDFAINVAVVDEAGLLRGFLRMDGAVPGAIDVSIKKARTAALFRTDSLTLGAAAAAPARRHSSEISPGERSSR